MANLSKHRLIQQAYNVCQAIEKCGASPELTAAVTEASDLMRSLDAFFPDFTESNGMSFGLALVALKEGARVARAGWNGKGMWLVLDPGSIVSEVRVGSAYHKAGVTGSFTINPHIDMKTATGEMQPGWLASQTDMLADDWGIVDGK